MWRVLRRVARWVRDTFAAGAEERRFRILESEMRALQSEMEHTLAKWALRSATDARRRLREAEKAHDQIPEQLSLMPPSPQQNRAAWKAQVRQQIERTHHAPPRHQPPAEEETG